MFSTLESHAEAQKKGHTNRVRLFGWHSVPHTLHALPRTLKVLAVPAEDDLHWPLDQEVLGCFVRAAFGVVSY